MGSSKTEKGSPETAPSALLYGTFIAALVASLGLASVVISHAGQQKKEVELTPPVLTAFHTQDLALSHRAADFRGELKNPFTLVEFFDYECPPCRRSDQLVQDALARNPAQLRLAVVNFPLNMHRHAKLAATVAEETRGDARFWQMHDALMEEPVLTDDSIGAICKRFGFDAVTAQKDERVSATIKNDQLIAKRMGVNATPSFYLCTPRGDVYKLTSLIQVDSLIQSQNAPATGKPDKA